MIDLTGMISVPFLKKSRFTGSDCGMRYLLQKEERAEETVLCAVIWPEPYNYEMTPDEKKHSRDFPLSKEGIGAAVAWLNEEHEAGHY